MDFSSEEEVRQALKCNREYMGKEACLRLPAGLRSLAFRVLWRACWVPDAALDAGETAVSRVDRSLPSWRLRES